MYLYYSVVVKGAGQIHQFSLLQTRIFFIAKRFAIAVPTRLTPVVTPGWMFGFTGLLNGGKNILAQEGEVWW